MSSEDINYFFRKKLESLDTPPPQTRWNASKSWQQIDRHLRPVPLRRKWIGWYPAVAAAILGVASSFLFYRYTLQQAQINQLTAELQRANASLLQQQTATIRKIDKTVAESTVHPDTAQEKAQVVEKPAKLSVTTKQSGIRNVAIQDTMLEIPHSLKKEQISQVPPGKQDSGWHERAVSPVQLLGARPGTQAKHRRRETTVILVFPGEATATSEPASTESIVTEKNTTKWMKLGNPPATTRSSEDPANQSSSGLLLKIK
jgi:type II secretory pathway pseudopilin PulG